MDSRFYICLLVVISALLETAWGCPGCAGSMDNPKETYTAYILGGFILLTAVPFYFLYRTIYKYRNINDTTKE